MKTTRLDAGTLRGLLALGVFLVAMAVIVAVPALELDAWFIAVAATAMAGIGILIALGMGFAKMFRRSGMSRRSVIGRVAAISIIGLVVTFAVVPITMSPAQRDRWVAENFPQFKSGIKGMAGDVIDAYGDLRTLNAAERAYREWQNDQWRIIGGISLAIVVIAMTCIMSSFVVGDRAGDAGRVV